MAALTWRDVTAPNYQGIQQSINGAAELLAKGTSGLSGALTQFGDQQALQQLAKYSDAQKLQADIQSGQFNTANASPEALAAIMGRPTSLISDATSAEQLAFRKSYNPLMLENQGTVNKQASFNFGQDQSNEKYLNEVTRPIAATANARADDLFNRTETKRISLLAAEKEFNTSLTNGSVSDISKARALLNSKSGEPPEVVAFWTQALSGRFPGLLAAPVASPLDSGIGSFGSDAQVPGTAGNTITGAGTRTGDSYDAVLGYGAFGLPNKPVSQSTLSELGDFGRNTLIPATKGNTSLGLPPDKGSSAVGKYQFTQETVANLAPKVFGNSWQNTVFTPENQDKLAEALFNERKNGNLKDTWQGLPNATAGAYKDKPWSEMKDIISSVESPVNKVPTPQQLGNSAASSAALNSMAILGANTPEVTRWLAATATPGNGSLADVANELKKGSLASVPFNRIQEMLQQTAAATNTTSDARLAGELLKSSLSGDSTFRFGFGSDTFGNNPDFNDKLLKENITKYNNRSKTTDSIQAGRTLEQGTAALAETQKRVEELKAYRDAKKTELARGVYGVTPNDIVNADAALQQALGIGTQIQTEINNFRPKGSKEETPSNPKPTPNDVAPSAAKLLGAAATVIPENTPPDVAKRITEQNSRKASQQLLKDTKDNAAKVRLETLTTESAWLNEGTIKALNPSEAQAYLSKYQDVLSPSLARALRRQM
jgi:hypothetical protein